MTIPQSLLNTNQSDRAKMMSIFAEYSDVLDVLSCAMIVSLYNEGEYSRVVTTVNGIELRFSLS